MRAALRFLACLALARALPPTLVPCPARDCLAPDVALDDAGVLHVAYGTSTKQALYQRSRDGGRTWDAPRALNGPENVTTTMGERGPKLSVPAGVGGAQVYVLWADLWFPGARVFARLAASRDGGASFGAPVAASDVWGIDGATVAADGAGGVLVAWHWGNATTPRPPNATQATWLMTAASRDFGATFAPSARAAFAPGAGPAAPVACSMCAMRARAAGRAGAFELAFRSAVDDVREHWVAELAPGAAQWSAVRVPNASWYYPACPMNGPELVLPAPGAGDAPVVAFMSGAANAVFWSALRGGALSAPVGTPPGAGAGRDERYPTAVAAGGRVLMVWQVGPMAVEGTASVRWAVYDAATGAFSGDAGVVGTTFAGTKATAWASGGEFFIMWSAA